MEDVNISETSDGQRDWSIEGGDKVVVSNSQVADQPNFVDWAEIKIRIQKLLGYFITFNFLKLDLQ